MRFTYTALVLDQGNGNIEIDDDQLVGMSDAEKKTFVTTEIISNLLRVHCRVGEVSFGPSDLPKHEEVFVDGQPVGYVADNMAYGSWSAITKTAALHDFLTRDDAVTALINPSRSGQR